MCSGNILTSRLAGRLVGWRAGRLPPVVGCPGQPGPAGPAPAQPARPGQPGRPAQARPANPTPATPARRASQASQAQQGWPRPRSYSWRAVWRAGWHEVTPCPLPGAATILAPRPFCCPNLKPPRQCRLSRLKPLGGQNPLTPQGSKPLDFLNHTPRCRGARRGGGGAKMANRR